MQSIITLVFLAVAAPVAICEIATTNPLGKVIELLTSLEAKIIKEGEVEAKAYKEYIEWCDDATKNTAYEIETAKNKRLNWRQPLKNVLETSPLPPLKSKISRRQSPPTGET